MIFGHFWNCKKWILVQKFFREIDLFDFRNYFGLDFLKFSWLCGLPKPQLKKWVEQKLYRFFSSFLPKYFFWQTQKPQISWYTRPITNTKCIFGIRDINQTSCEDRGCCYQPLNLQPEHLCHRKIPSTHTMKTLMENQTDATLQYFQVYISMYIVG